MLTPYSLVQHAIKVCVESRARAHKLLTKRQLAASQIGASMVEFVVVVPVLLMMILGVVQTGLVYFAKSNVNYAAFEAARAGSVSHATQASIRDAFTRAMVGYYGGGRNASELAESLSRASADITAASMQIELLSPTKESFDDYASPRLSQKLGTQARVIPNNNLSTISCPLDKPSCNNDPNSNHSGQTLSDANLLKVRITYGIPSIKQVPMVGRFYTRVLQGLDGEVKSSAETEPFKKALLAQGRIPVVVHTTIRMQSEPIENGNVSNPGAGNNGVPTPPTPIDPVDPTDPVQPADPVEPPDPDEEPCDASVDASCNPKDNPCPAGAFKETLPDNLLFAFGSSTLSNEGKGILDRLIATINDQYNKQAPDQYESLIIHGYTDKIGNEQDNEILSEDRARAISDYLKAGINPNAPLYDSLNDFVGHGERNPVTSSGVCTEDKTPENIANCQPDRRVEFVYIK